MVSDNLKYVCIVIVALELLILLIPLTILGSCGVGALDNIVDFGFATLITHEPKNEKMLLICLGGFIDIAIPASILALGIIIIIIGKYVVVINEKKAVNDVSEEL